jgi:hypothetical protein
MRDVRVYRGRQLAVKQAAQVLTVAQAAQVLGITQTATHLPLQSKALEAN